MGATTGTKIVPSTVTTQSTCEVRWSSVVNSVPDGTTAISPLIVWHTTERLPKRTNAKHTRRSQVFCDFNRMYLGQVPEVAVPMEMLPRAISMDQTNNPGNLIFFSPTSLALENVFRSFEKRRKKWKGNIWFCKKILRKIKKKKLRGAEKKLTENYFFLCWEMEKLARCGSFLSPQNQWRISVIFYSRFTKMESFKYFIFPLNDVLFSNCYFISSLFSQLLRGSSRWMMRMCSVHSSWIINKWLGLYCSVNKQMDASQMLGFIEGQSFQGFLLEQSVLNFATGCWVST